MIERQFTNLFLALKGRECCLYCYYLSNLVWILYLFKQLTFISASSLANHNGWASLSWKHDKILPSLDCSAFRIASKPVRSMLIILPYCNLSSQGRLDTIINYQEIWLAGFVSDSWNHGGLIDLCIKTRRTRPVDSTEVYVPPGC